MALYMALKIEAGVFKYEELFAYRPYQRFQSDVDAILIADGYKDLIKK